MQGHQPSIEDDKKSGSLPKKKRKPNESTEVFKHPQSRSSAVSSSSPDIQYNHRLLVSEGETPSSGGRGKEKEEEEKRRKNKGEAKTSEVALAPPSEMIAEDQVLHLQSISTDILMTSSDNQLPTTITSAKTCPGSFSDGSTPMATSQPATHHKMAAIDLGLASDEEDIEEATAADKRVFANVIRLGREYVRFSLPKLQKALMLSKRSIMMKEAAAAAKQKKPQQDRSKERQVFHTPHQTFTSSQHHLAATRNKHTTSMNSSTTSTTVATLSQLLLLPRQQPLNLGQIVKSMQQKSEATATAAETNMDKRSTSADSALLSEEREPEVISAYGGGQRKRRKDFGTSHQPEQQQLEKGQVYRQVEIKKALPKSHQKKNTSGGGGGGGGYVKQEKLSYSATVQKYNKKEPRMFSVQHRKHSAAALQYAPRRSKLQLEISGGGDEHERDGSVTGGGDLLSEDIDITLSKDMQTELLKYHKKSKNYYGTAKQFGVSHDEARTIIKMHKTEFRMLPNN